MLKALVIDDEKFGRDGMQSLLTDYCPEVQVIGTADSALTAIKEIRAKNPDLVFLDVEMPHGTGFNVLESVPDMDFEVIFTTAYNQYAIQAIRFSAIDYLLKPIDHKELIEAVKRAGEKRATGLRNPNLELLIENLKSNGAAKKIAVATSDGILFVEIDGIIRCESSNNYTLIHMKNGAKHIVSKSLSEHEDQLAGTSFFRTHNSHLINLNCVSKFLRGSSSSVIMSDGVEIEVARRKKEEFLVAMSKISKL